MERKDAIRQRTWTPEEIRDDRLRNFMIRNRDEMLAVLVSAHATNKTMLTERLVNEWRKEEELQQVA